MIRWFKKHFFPHRGNHHHPHILRHKSLSAVVAVVILLELTMLLGPLVLPRLGIQLAAVLPSVITLLTNNARANNQLAGVKMNNVLTLAAQTKAEDMASKGYFSHISPDGSEPWYWFDAVGYKYQYAGENLAVNFTDSEQLLKAWQNSPTHNLNLLGPRYTETGVGVATGMYQGREAVFVVQFLASPDKQFVVAKPTPVVETVAVKVVEERKPAPNPIVLGAVTQIISSPRTYDTYALLVLVLLFIAVLVIGLGRHHPRAFVNGIIILAVLVGVMYVNKYFMFPELSVLGEESVTEKINARLLPTLWFSSLTAKEGDSVKVYAAIQNNSGINFSGAVIFSADNAEIGKVSFSSPTDSLKEISVVWRAIAGGKHTFRAVVSTDLSSGTELVSSESGEASFDISRKITLEEVKENAGEIVNTIKEKVDELASTFADKLESTKNPITSNETSGKVLGTTTDARSLIPASVYNAGIDITSNLIRNWMWTLSGLTVLGLVWSFRS